MLSPGSIKKLFKGKNVNNPILEILAYKELTKQEGDKRYRLLLTDGVLCSSGFILLGDLNNYIENHTLKRHTIIELNEFYTKESHTRLKYIIFIKQLRKIEDKKIENTEAFSKNLSNLDLVDNFAKSPLTISIKHLCAEITKGVDVFDFTIKVRVEYKSPKTPWKKNEREGIYIKMKFQDENGDLINGITFDEKLYDKIQIEKVYYLSHFKLGRKYSNDEHCIILDYKTVINPVVDSAIDLDESLGMKVQKTSIQPSCSSVKSENTQNSVMKQSLVIAIFAIIITLFFWETGRQLHLYLPGKVK
ncbi:replication protein A 70 kDa DNA-binding subunit-like isoform X2 [Centruroides vittatus]|uniref:replication protein A 70 kDa DNA-binding subunit-like isoform X2 n=1 Tax=Centruroides vittatus TaxID=120091 RepID=UPI00350EAE4E